MTAAVTAYFHLHHHHNIRNITNNSITAICSSLIPSTACDCFHAVSRVHDSRLPNLDICRSAISYLFRPCFLPAGIYTSSPLIPVWLRLSLPSFISIFITIIIFATPSPPFVHRCHCCLCAYLLAQYVSCANFPNYCTTVSIPPTSLRLSPRSIRLVCQSPKFLYCFLCGFSCA